MQDDAGFTNFHHSSPYLYFGFPARFYGCTAIGGAAQASWAVGQSAMPPTKRALALRDGLSKPLEGNGQGVFAPAYFALSRRETSKDCRS